ncbi:hypothetical protein [Alistipes shahii]|jgi:hypothetical protein|uniref:hypothetical protein n=1 Tax=Alistipes putredinis TaxID=28117 RepID=UPI002666E384|nr:hypothetical protein [Alistipes shahii]
MRRYWFQLLTDKYDELGAFIPDGSNKGAAVNRAKRWMRQNGVMSAVLTVNSMATSNLLDTIQIEL